MHVLRFIEIPKIRQHRIDRLYFFLHIFQYHKRWLQERRSMKKNLHLRSQILDASDLSQSMSKYRPSLLYQRKKIPWNDTKSKYFNENQLDTPIERKSVQNDVLPHSDVIKVREESENDVTYTMPTTATTTTTTTTGESVSVQNEILSARRRADLLATTTASTMPTNRMANVTPISIPVLASDNNVVKAVIESPAGQPNMNRTRVDARTNRRVAKAAWGRWHPWTICSRSCGGGVMSQTRECLSR